MTVLISLLRGVNIGGRHQIKMEALRDLYESLGLRHPQTYIQSGNVVFATKERNLAPLPQRIEDAIEKSFGFRPSVILRTAPELQEVIAGNPFAARTGINPSKLIVTFLASEPSPEARDKVLAIKTHPDELHLTGRHLYIYFLNGMGQPTVAWGIIERALKTAGSARNWNTVNKLMEMAARLESEM